jgi:uncharacterized protein (DUF433 family)
MALRQPDAYARIARNPSVLGGEPIVRGTRIPVRSIVLAAREYETPAAVAGAYPQLTPADVNEALAYYEAHAPEIDAFIRANLLDD